MSLNSINNRYNPKCNEERVTIRLTSVEVQLFCLLYDLKIEDKKSIESKMTQLLESKIKQDSSNKKWNKIISEVILSDAFLQLHEYKPNLFNIYEKNEK